MNDRNKNAANRQRFLRRYKEQIRRSVADTIGRRGIKEMDTKGADVTVPNKDISEPTFHHGRGGDREIVHTGNKEFHAGDKIPRPTGGGGGGAGSGGGGGDSTDEFTFALSREEFMNLFFDDLALPHLLKTALGDARDFKWRRAGYTPTGVPGNLSVTRSLRQAMGRRIALTAGAKRELAALALVEGPEEVLDDVGERVRRLKAQIERVPYVDPIDLRYRHRVKDPQPISQAVMFCLMDVSASMTEVKKDLAKRFFTLLYLFLSRKYEKVELVFIRHTDDAEEVDEDRFFHDTKSGGTVVFSALALMHTIIEARYPTSTWNIYGAQVSDGDAFGADPERSKSFLEKTLLPLVRYFAYVEVPDHKNRASDLAKAYAKIDDGRFAMRSVMERNQIYPVLRELFKRETAGAFG